MRALAGRGLVLSVLSLLCAGGALAAFVRDQAVVGALLVIACALIDTVAGQAGGSAVASVVDGVLDLAGDALMLGGMAVWADHHSDLPGPYAVGFVALAGALALAYASARTRASAGEEAARTLFGYTGRDVRLVLLGGGGLVGLAWWALLLFALLSHGPVVAALLRLPPLLREKS